MGINDINPATLDIKKFIFHVVDPKKDEAVLLKEVPLGNFKSFFLSRVKETIKGNRFIFVEGSSTLDTLKQLREQPEMFVQLSQKLAIDFHSRHNLRANPGVLILMTLSYGDKTLYALIKYDHDEVISYEIENGDVAKLVEVANSLTQSKESLQKSAVIDIDKNEVLVIDRNVRHEITDYYKGFLGVKRKYTNTELTNAVYDITMSTYKKHKGSLPKEITRNIRKLISSTIEGMEHFGNVEDYLTRVFGPHVSDAILETFRHDIKKNDLDGESFEFNDKELPKPKKMKLETQEGITVEYSENNRNNIQRSEKNGQEVITITTSKVFEL